MCNLDTPQENTSTHSIIIKFKKIINLKIKQISLGKRLQSNAKTQNKIKI